MDDLNNAVNNFYRAFAEVPVPDKIDGCACCLNQEEIEKLLSTTLREISSDELAPYASSAFLTVGEVSDYIYFLPRIMEITIYDESWWPDIEVTARAIQSSGLHSWPQFRRDVLSSLLQAFLNHIVNIESHDRIDGLLCAIGRMDIDVHPYLAIIETNIKAVLAFWEDNSGKLNEGKLGNAFWELPNRGHDEIVKWFQSESISRIYTEAYGYKR